MFTLVILLASLSGEPLHRETIRVEECPDKKQVEWAVGAYAEIHDLGRIKYKWSCVPDERT